MPASPQRWGGRRQGLTKILPRRWTLALSGLLLGLAAPVGLGVVECLAEGLIPHPSWMVSMLAEHAHIYAYVTLSTVGTLSALGWWIGRGEEQLKQRSDTDALTDLPNRRYLDVRLADALEQTARYGNPLSLLMLDLDHLKSINDQLGHAQGDRALSAVAASLTSTCRATDTPARVGGDEFAVLALGTNAVEAMELAERIRARLNQERLPGGRPVTVSVGVADVHDCGCRNAEQLLGTADDALYQAKNAGRDRVVRAAKCSPDLSETA